MPKPPLRCIGIKTTRRRGRNKDLLGKDALIDIGVRLKITLYTHSTPSNFVHITNVARINFARTIDSPGNFDERHWEVNKHRCC